MINRHSIAYSNYTKNYYILDNSEAFFEGFDSDGNPLYCKSWGKLYETREAAALQAQMLNDMSCALNQVKHHA